MKMCTCCKRLVELEGFSPDVRTKDGRQSRCKPCQAETAKAHRMSNPEAHREAVRRSTEKHYLKKLARNTAYRASNPEKIRQWKRKDRFENKSRILSDNAKRRAIGRQYENTSEVRQMYALRDFYIAMSLGEPFHVDHIQPLSRGGAHTVENLQVIPAIDNLRKGAR